MDPPPTAAAGSAPVAPSQDGAVEDVSNLDSALLETLFYNEMLLMNDPSHTFDMSAILNGGSCVSFPSAESPTNLNGDVCSVPDDTTTTDGSTAASFATSTMASAHPMPAPAAAHPPAPSPLPPPVGASEDRGDATPPTQQHWQPERTTRDLASVAVAAPPPHPPAPAPAAPPPEPPPTVRGQPASRRESGALAHQTDSEKPLQRSQAQRAKAEQPPPVAAVPSSLQVASVPSSLQVAAVPSSLQVAAMPSSLPAAPVSLPAKTALEQAQQARVGNPTLKPPLQPNHQPRLAVAATPGALPATLMPAPVFISPSVPPVRKAQAPVHLVPSGTRTTPVPIAPAGVVPPSPTSPPKRAPPHITGVVPIAPAPEGSVAPNNRAPQRPTALQPQDAPIPSAQAAQRRASVLTGPQPAATTRPFPPPPIAPVPAPSPAVPASRHLPPIAPVPAPSPAAPAPHPPPPIAPVPAPSPSAPALPQIVKLQAPQPGAAAPAPLPRIVKLQAPQPGTAAPAPPIPPQGPSLQLPTMQSPPITSSPAPPVKHTSSTHPQLQTQPQLRVAVTTQAQPQQNSQPYQQPPPPPPVVISGGGLPALAARAMLTRAQQDHKQQLLQQPAPLAHFRPAVPARPPSVNASLGSVATVVPIIQQHQPPKVSLHVKQQPLPGTGQYINKGAQPTNALLPPAPVPPTPPLHSVAHTPSQVAAVVMPKSQPTSALSTPAALNATRPKVAKENTSQTQHRQGQKAQPAQALVADPKQPRPYLNTPVTAAPSSQPVQQQYTSTPQVTLPHQEPGKQPQQPTVSQSKPEQVQVQSHQRLAKSQPRANPQHCPLHPGKQSANATHPPSQIQSQGDPFSNTGQAQTQPTAALPGTAAPAAAAPAAAAPAAAGAQAQQLVSQFATLASHLGISLPPNVLNSLTAAAQHKLQQGQIQPPVPLTVAPSPSHAPLATGALGATNGEQGSAVPMVSVPVVPTSAQVQPAVVATSTASIPGSAAATTTPMVMATVPSLSPPVPISATQLGVAAATLPRNDSLARIRDTAEEAIAAVRDIRKRPHPSTFEKSTLEDGTTVGDSADLALVGKSGRASNSRRKKKPRLEDCELKLKALRAENETLRRHLSNVQNKTQRFDLERRRQEQQMRELVHAVQTGKADEEQLKGTLAKFSEMYSDYGRQRQEELQFHLEQLERLAIPTTFTKMTLWTMGQNDQFFLRPKSNPIAGILMRELGITPQQGRKIIEHRDRIKKVCENIRQCLVLLERLKGLCEHKHKLFKDRMNRCQEILTPLQVVKLLIWVDDHQGILENVCPGWGSERIRGSDTVSSSENPESSAGDTKTASTKVVAGGAVAAAVPLPVGDNLAGQGKENSVEAVDPS